MPLQPTDLAKHAEYNERIAKEKAERTAMFDELRAKRNAGLIALRQTIADKVGVPISEVHMHFDPDECYCACDKEPRGLCEHVWTGPTYTSDDGCIVSSTCVRCRMTSFHHDMMYLP